MQPETTVVAGIEIPSTSPVFLTIVGVHVLLGILCVVSGILAMLSEKRAGGHPRAGTFYYWCLAAVFGTATALAIVRWEHDYHLFILGTLAFAAATLGRMARRRHWRGWVKTHIISMGASYILLLTAFYVDNGRFLPLWKELPPLALWLLPSAVGVPLIAYALLTSPLVRSRSSLRYPG